MVACNACKSGLFVAGFGQVVANVSQVWSGPVLSCAVLSSDVLPSSVLSYAALTLYVVSCVSTDVIFVFFQFLLLLFPSLRVVALSLCLSRLLSVFVFCPRPCFEHLSTVQTCTPTPRAALYEQSDLSRPLYPCYHHMCIIAKGLGRAGHRCGHLRLAKWTQEPPRCSRETASHSAPASLPLPFQVAPFLHPVYSVVFTLCPNCSLAVLLPSMLMVLCIFQMITVPTFASGSNAKNVWHFSDHVVCRVDVSSLGLNVLSPP